MNTSHTHAGPRVSRWGYSDGPDLRYLDRIEEVLVSTALTALHRLRKADIWAGCGKTFLPLSRRNVGADGIARWAPCMSADVCRHLPFCMFRDKSGEIIALLFSVSCHPSMIYSLDISADYPGAAVRHLNRLFNTDGAVFLQGAGGDTKPRQIAVAEERWRHGTWEDVEAAGREVAQAVWDAACKRVIRVEPSFKWAIVETKWPLAAPPTRQWFRRLAGDPHTPISRRRWAEDMIRILEMRGRLPDLVPVQFHGVRIGNGLRLVGVEGELVGELGNLIVDSFPRGVTFPLGYSNGAQIYLPTSRMILQRGYEVDSYWEYHWPAPLRQGAEKIIRWALRLASQK